MFEHWISATRRFSERFGLETAAMISAHQLVVDHMGPEWVAANCSRDSSRKMRAISEVHPLALALKGAAEECVLDVLRLASYLCAFRLDPKIDEALASLREPDKYDPTMFELAAGWGFRRAGADVSLFPLTPNGSADLALSVDGRAYTVETSGFPSDALRDNAMSFTSAMNDALIKAETRAGLSHPVVLEIEVDDVDGRDRSPAYSAIKDAVRAFVEPENARSEQRFSFGRIVLRSQALGEHGPTGDWTCAMRTNMGHLTLLRDLSDDPDPLVRLSKKLKREASQLSGCTDGVIVLDIEALGVDLINDRERLHAAAMDFGRSHRSTTGVAFVVMSYHQNGHRGLSGHYFALAPTALSETWFQHVLAHNEGDGLFQELSVLSVAE